MKNSRVFFLSVLAVLAFVFACSSKRENRMFLGVGREPQSISEVVDQLPRLLEAVENPAKYNSGRCSVVPDAFSKYFSQLRNDFFSPTGPSEVEFLKENLDQTIEKLFKFQVQIRNRYQQFPDANENCKVSLIRALRVSRVAIDYLIDWGFENEIYLEGELLGLDGPFPHTLASPEAGDLKIRTGDLLLQRTNSVVAATVARIGDEDSNFSHLSIVGEDQATGRQYVFDADPIVGVRYLPIEQWLREPTSVRVMQLRFQDEQLAVKAGRAVFEYVQARLRKEKVIPYDFKMNAFEYSEFFCSELVHAAYEWASDGKVRLPELPTSLKKFDNHQFLKQTGIEARMTFAPGDIEADRRFRVLREWRHIARVADKKSPFRGVSRLTQVRIQDAAITSIFEWMFKYNYEFHFDFGSWMESTLAKGLLSMGIGTNYVQRHVPEKFISSTIRMVALTEMLEEKMLAFDRRKRKETGMGVGFQELLDVNERYRKQDCQVYKKYKSWRAPRRGGPRMKRMPNPNPGSDFHKGYRTQNPGDPCAL